MIDHSKGIIIFLPYYQDNSLDNGLLADKLVKTSALIFSSSTDT